MPTRPARPEPMAGRRRPTGRWGAIALAAIAWLCALTPASAQVASASPDSITAQAAAIDQAQADLKAATQSGRARALSDAELKARLADIPPIQARLADALDALTPRLTDVDARLAQLGPPPGPGQPPEAVQTSSTRRNLQHFREQVDTEVKLARLLTVEAQQTAKALADKLRRNFSARLWAQSRSVGDPTLWRDFALAAPADAARLSGAFYDEGKALQAAASPEQIAFWLIAAALALVLIGPGRIWLIHQGFRRAAAGGDTRLRRSLLALWRVFVAAATPVIGLILVRGALDQALTAEFNDFADLLIRVVAFAALLQGMGAALLSVGRPQWRMAPIPDRIVARLAHFPSLIGAAAGMATLTAGVNSILAASLATSVAVDCLTVLAEIAAVGGALAMVGRARREHLSTGEVTAPVEAEGGRVAWVAAALAAWLALGAALASVLTGYLAMASFLMHETIWIGAVLAAVYILLHLADDLFPALLSPAGPLGRAIQTGVGLSDSALEQIGVLLSGAVRLGLLLIGWTSVLAPFGASADDIVGRVTATNWVLQVGQLSISAGSILGAVGLFLLGLLLTRAVRGWLEARYLPKTDLDVGVRTSLAVAVNYAGVVFAILFAFAYLGLSFSQIALFASALSVGIGFGLQAIIGNFVSGLILLAERPIKVGDWIAIGELEGDVKAINIRATEIEMMDRSKLIVPNSDLISKTVRNVTHGVASARLRIGLRTDASIDPTLVRDLMLARMRAHPEVLTLPAPAVFLSDIRDGGLDFAAFAYVNSARAAYRVKSELLFQIVPDLRAKGIALANSATIVNIGLPDRLIEPEGGHPA